MEDFRFDAGGFLELGVDVSEGVDQPVGAGAGGRDSCVYVAERLNGRLQGYFCGGGPAGVGLIDPRCCFLSGWRWTLVLLKDSHRPVFRGVVVVYMWNRPRNPWIPDIGHAL